MSTFALIHGAGDVGWYWHLVAAELRSRGHDVVAPDLPADDESATLTDYADAVVEAVGSRKDLVVAGQSYGAFTSPLVAGRLDADALVLVAGMIPAPGEAPDDWWSNTGCSSAVGEQAARDGGLTGNPDPYVSFYHDLPRELAKEAMSKERAHPSQGLFCAARIASSRRTSSGGWWPNATALCPTRSPVATVWPSAGPKSWRTYLKATPRRPPACNEEGQIRSRGARWSGYCRTASSPTALPLPRTAVDPAARARRVPDRCSLGDRQWGIARSKRKETYP